MAESGNCHANYPTLAANFYSFIEEETFNAAVDATVYRDDVAESAKKVYYYDDLYPALETTDAYFCEPLMDFGDHTQATVNTAIPMPQVRFDSEPTPGKLLPGQFGARVAITEISPSPKTSNYEYIEVMNTTDYPVNIKDYYIYRFMFTNYGGASEYVGLQQMTGNGADNYNVKHFSSSLFFKKYVNYYTGYLKISQ